MDNEKILKKVTAALQKKMSITQVYLFGSRARGTFYIDSDYDFAIVSDDFSLMSFDARQKLVRPLIRKVLGTVSLDVSCYTKLEFFQGRGAYLPSIIEKEGIRA